MKPFGNVLSEALSTKQPWYAEVYPTNKWQSQTHNSKHVPNNYIFIWTFMKNILNDDS
jgi:hypothetical protein